MALQTKQKQKLRKGASCQCCGLSNHLSASLYGRPLEIHHIQARKDGGTDSQENLATLCPTCHASWHRYAELELKATSKHWEWWKAEGWKEGLTWMYASIANSGSPAEKKLHKLDRWGKALNWMQISGA